MKEKKRKNVEKKGKIERNIGKMEEKNRRNGRINLKNVVEKKGRNRKKLNKKSEKIE